MPDRRKNKNRGGSYRRQKADTMADAVCDFLPEGLRTYS